MANKKATKGGKSGDQVGASGTDEPTAEAEPITCYQVDRDVNNHEVINSLLHRLSKFDIFVGFELETTVDKDLFSRNWGSTDNSAVPGDHEEYDDECECAMCVSNSHREEGNHNCTCNECQEYAELVEALGTVKKPKGWDDHGDGSINVSISGYRSREFVSIPLNLSSNDDMKIFVDGVTTINKMNPSTNSSCGFHLHVTVKNKESSWEPYQYAALMAIFSRFESVVYSLLPRSRAVTKYSAPINETYLPSEWQKLVHHRTKQDAVEALWYRENSTESVKRRKASRRDSTRYCGLNLGLAFHCVDNNDTPHLEFRHHSGTTDIIKILQWTELCVSTINLCNRLVYTQKQCKKLILRNHFLSVIDYLNGNNLQSLADNISGCATIEGVADDFLEILPVGVVAANRGMRVYSIKPEIYDELIDRISDSFSLRRGENMAPQFLTIKDIFYNHTTASANAVRANDDNIYKLVVCLEESRHTMNHLLKTKMFFDLLGIPKESRAYWFNRMKLLNPTALATTAARAEKIINSGGYMKADDEGVVVGSRNSQYGGGYQNMMDNGISFRRDSAPAMVFSTSNRPVTPIGLSSATSTAPDTWMTIGSGSTAEITGIDEISSAENRQPL